MKKGLLIVLTLCICMMAHAQQESQTLVIEQNAEMISVDPQGNIYAVNDATLYKYAPDGSLLHSYNNNLLGHIFSIDVDNPLKIMLFYREAGTILFLNDKLSPIGNSVDLFSKELTTITLATYSTKNELILYDESNTDLIFLDFYFREKERIHYDFQDLHPIQLKDVNEKSIIMQDPEQGFFFFDNFGTFITGSATILDQPAQIIDGGIVYVKDNYLNIYNFWRLDLQRQCEVPEEVKQVLVYQDKIIFLEEKTIKIMHRKTN